MSLPTGPRLPALLVAALVTLSPLVWGAPAAHAGRSGPDLVGPVAEADPGPQTAATGSGALTGPVITVRGRGYGHGRGMSQWGAKGAAQQGLDHRDIIDFYYPGTTWATVRGRVQVLLGADTSPDVVVEDRDRLRVRGVGAATTSWRSLSTPDAVRWRVSPDAGGGSVVAAQVASGAWRSVLRLPGPAEISAAGRPVRLVLPGGATRGYRGALRSVVPPPGSSDGPGDRDTVNVVSVESYLRGVVPLEMPALWAPEAVRAQAVAARSYVAWERAHPRNSHYQVCDTTSCQVYGGADAEHPASDAAVRATRRVARFAGGEPAFTQFSASNGGWTARGSFAYLPARRDRHEVGSGNTYASWTRTIAWSSIEAWRPAIGTLRAVRPGGRDGNGEWNGRVGTVTLLGTRATVTVSGEAFRSGFALPSTWFTTG